MIPGLMEYIKEVVRAETAKYPIRMLSGLTVGGSIACAEDISIDGILEVTGSIETANELTVAADTHLVDVAVSGTLDVTGSIETADELTVGAAAYLNGATIIGATENLYWGPTAASGSWRIGRDGNNLVIQRREGDPLGWVTKSTISA